jgi:hypothetical protein
MLGSSSFAAPLGSRAKLLVVPSACRKARSAESLFAPGWVPPARPATPGSQNCTGLYRSGLSAKGIAETVGLSYTSTCRILRRAGLPADAAGCAARQDRDARIVSLRRLFGAGPSLNAGADARQSNLAGARCPLVGKMWWSKV